MCLKVLSELTIYVNRPIDFLLHQNINGWGGGGLLGWKPPLKGKYLCVNKLIQATAETRKCICAKLQPLKRGYIEFPTHLFVF